MFFLCFIGIHLFFLNPAVAQTALVSDVLYKDHASLNQFNYKNYPWSYHRLLLDETDDPYQHLFGKCLKDVRKLIKDGASFESETIKKRTKKIEDQNFKSGIQDRVFFHYTNAERMRTITALQDVDSIFRFLRMREYGSDYPTFSSLFMAEDPKSSDYFGRIGVSVKVKAGATIFEATNFQNSIKDLIQQDLYQRFPILKSCPDEVSRINAESAILDLAIEASGVDLVDYHEGGDWFQLFNPFAIESLSIKK